MDILSSFLIAVSLSMDNLAVAVCAGSAHPVCPSKMLCQISLLFALFHFAMFAFGFEGGMLVHISQSVGPWIACVILVLIGLRMIGEALSAQSQHEPPLFSSLKTQVVVAAATSLDALFVGGGLAISHAPFWQTTALLVVCVFITSWCGFYLGGWLGKKFGRNMEIAGGSALILLGVKVLLETKGIW